MLEVNKVYNMDCSDGLQQIDDETIDLVILDPPYSSGQVHKTHNGRFNQNKGSLIKFDDLSERGFTIFIKPILDELYRVLKISSHLYCYVDWKQLRNLMDLIELSSFKLNGLLVWDKMKFGCGRPWRSQVEYIIYASKGQARTGNMLNNPNIFHVKRSGNLYEKPIEIAKTIINTTTDENDIVMDVFAGNGSTLLAAKSRGRRFIGFELNKERVQIIEKRLSMVISIENTQINKDLYPNSMGTLDTF